MRQLEKLVGEYGKQAENNSAWKLEKSLSVEKWMRSEKIQKELNMQNIMEQA